MQVQDIDVLVISGLWSNELLKSAKKLSYIQSISAGYDQFPLSALRKRRIRLANAAGVNRDAVAQHAMGLILSFARQLHLARDNQRLNYWRPMISSVRSREDDLRGRVMLVVGLGDIGTALAQLARSFGMKIIGIKRDISKPPDVAHAVYPPNKLDALVSDADFIVLCCPLNADTKNIINTSLLKKMKSSAYLINVARGGCIDERALLEAIQNKDIAGAGLDHFSEEPLSSKSPFWGLSNVLITPHSAGETQKYEVGIIDILTENLKKMDLDDRDFTNRIV
tara:strand:- start:698 stop:1540 length:843 start_codon:yes stop_codon:yes gene_type:complete